MSVVNTRIWIKKFIEQCEKNPRKNPAAFQVESICTPLQSVFPHIPPKDLMALLLKHGLFNAKEWQEISRINIDPSLQDPWVTIEKDFQLLKKRWNGPDCPIYILPIRTDLKTSDESPFEKNGLAFKQGVFLFISPSLSLGSLKAIFAHEYNHVCRLHQLNVPIEKMTLKESLIIEGLGEYSVKELGGERFLAPWTHLYTEAERIKIWKKAFLPELTREGTDHHRKFLYGTNKKALPKWIGYHIGFHIICSYIEQNGPRSMKQLLTVSSDEIICKSAFKLDN
ncbi:DUF2268 domain-containing protein [Jeotgalibacillus campisalis]|uniref:DUF2268 domain-containing protein n=1 Tax=Jeotgalibacillus campisalis TaxID=220754 RepID=A0A0C2VHT5_9BACL|nr:DUF2268 domain-containing putative Zn-dependent protease [Jeotgalibacillus campisalis]KIL48437.1 hypothetical protein KR50_14730 [Jeotgalibacillus campisalis]